MARKKSDKPQDYVGTARRRLEKIEAGKFNFDKAYSSYLKEHQRYVGSKRHMAKQLSKQAFERTYKRVTSAAASAQIAGSSIKNISKIIASSEVLTSQKQARAYAKNARKLAERYEKSGTPEELELAQILKQTTTAEFLQYGEATLSRFAERAIALGVKAPGKDFKSKSSHNPKHVFWEVFYPPKAKKGGKK